MNIPFVLEPMFRCRCMLAVVAAALWMSAGVVHAQSAAFTPNESALPLPARMHVGSTPVGGVLWTSTKATSRKIDSNQIAGFLWQVGDPVLVSGYADVYRTSISGIGIRWHNQFFGNTFPAGVSLAHNGRSVAAKGIDASLPMQQVWFELVRVAAAITPGALTVTGKQRVAFNCGAADACNWYTSVTGSTAITVGTCDMPASIPVDLGDHKATDFTAVGTVSSWVDFNIPLRNCPSTYTSLYYQITPTYGTGPGPGHLLLGIRPGGATGVMIDLWNRNNNEAPPIGLNVLVGGVAPGTPNVDLGFRARIYQTEARVTPGAVESSMEVRIDYF